MVIDGRKRTYVTHGLTDLCAHGQPRTEAEDTHQHRELLPVRPQEAGPVVHEAGHQGLHVAELRVNTENLEVLRI